MKKYLGEIYEFRELLGNLVVTELKLRYRESFLGFLWTILNPLLFLLILAVVFSQIFKFQIENYVIFILSGLTSWMMLQQTVITATGSIVNNQALIRKVYVPKIIFPLASVLARYVDHLILILVLFVFMGIFKMPFTWNLLFILPALLMHFFFTLGLALIASVAYIRVKDIQHIIAIAFQALFYLTPILYSLEALPPSYRTVFLLNPFYYFVQSFRYPVYNASLPPGWVLLRALLLTTFVFVIGFLIFLKKEKFFVFHLS